MTAIAATGLRRGENGTDEINKKIATSGTPVCSVKATGTLTLATQPTADDTITIGSVTYTFVAAGTAETAGEVNLGVDIAATKPLLVAAIGGDDNNAAHPDVVAADFSSDDMVVTAKIAGTAGNAIATTTDLDDGTDDFAAATLGSGVDGTPGEIGDCLIDSAYIYWCVAPVTDAGNWRRVSLGSAY